MKKKLLLALCFALALLSLSACDFLLTENSLGSEGTDSVSESSEESSITESPEESSFDEDSGENSADEDSSATPERIPLRTEIDRIGHKIAYYEDGTWADLGRVTPMDFSPRQPSERYGYRYLLTEEKSEELSAFYADLYETAEEFFSSKTDVAVKQDVYYPIGEIDCAAYSTLTKDDKVAVWKTFKQDYPEFFWLDNICYTAGDLFGLCIDEVYASGAARQRTQKAIESATLNFDGYVSGKMSDEEIAVTVYDYLATSIEYAYQTDGVTPSTEAWAYNLDGWASKGEGVCEAYAESFTYLCSFYGIESTVVVGESYTASGSGAHAWNIVALDGEWYTVDVTWSTVFEDVLLGTLLYRQWFGQEASVFNETHVANTPDGVGKDYQFALPKLSERMPTPVFLRENDGEAEWVFSIDKAFEKMTNEGSRYEITLYADTSVLREKGIALYMRDAKFYSDLPLVEELTFSRYNFGDEEKHGVRKASLDTDLSLTQSGALVLDNVYLSAASLNLGSFDLTLITSNIDTDSAITGETDSRLLVYADVICSVTAVDLPEVRIYSQSLELSESSRIRSLCLESADASVRLDAQKDVTFEVENVYLAERSGVIYLESSTAGTKLQIGNVKHAASPYEADFRVLVDVEKLENYPQIRFTGESDAPIFVAVDGRYVDVIRDADGNVLSREEKTLSITELSVPIVYLVEGIKTSQLRVFFVEWYNSGGTWVEKTSLYEKKENGGIALK